MNNIVRKGTVTTSSTTNDPICYSCGLRNPYGRCIVTGETIPVHSCSCYVFYESKEKRSK